MIAVDTNVLLRYLLHDDESRAARAEAVFEAGETVLVTDVVLAETVWTLAGRRYRLSNAELVGALERMFSDPYIRFEDNWAVWRAFQAFRGMAPADKTGSAKSIGFADALIVFKALQAASDEGEDLTVYTFDAAMQRLPHTTPP